MRTSTLLPLAPLLVAAVVVAAFANSIAGDFVFDDVFEVEASPAVRRLWPPWEAMTVGTHLPARLLPSWSFAIDHAIWGSSPRGYHVANILIHATAAIAVYEIARRTLAAPRLHGRFNGGADLLALAIAVVWAVHPLQTQAVTYIYQRIESMAGMFCLVALACFAQAASAGWSRRWLAGCVAAAAAAMASKESAIVLPLVILAYDWTFWAETPAAIAARRHFYAMLTATTAIVGLQLWLQRATYAEFKEAGTGPLAYALTQPGVILHYLRLVVWPTGQCLDYGWPIASSFGEIAVPLAVICGIVIATAVGLVRRKPWGWLGAAFLLTLAPTSSVMPVLAPAAEHRMYLPLAAVVAGIACGLWSFAADIAGHTQGENDRRAARLAVPLALLGLAVVLGLLTHQRNRLYRSREAMWDDVAHKRPDHFTPPMWMAGFAIARGDDAGAIRHAEEAVRRRPRCDIFGQLAATARNQGRLAAAESFLRHYLELTRTTLPADDMAVLAAKSALASTLSAARRQADAERLCGDIGAALDARAGPGDPFAEECRATCRAIVIRGLLQRRDVAAAVSLAAANHAAVVAALGAWHPTAQGAATALAAAWQAGGDTPRAERVLRDSLAAADRVAWRRTVDTTTTRDALATLLESAGRYDDAIRQRRMILEQTMAATAGNPAAPLRARLALLGAESARAWQKRMPADEAAISAAAVEAAIDGLGAGDPLAQRIVVTHAAILHRQGKSDAAEALLQKATRDAARDPAAGDGPIDLTTLRSGLADLYERISRVDEALALRQAVLRECLERHGAESEATQRAAAATAATAKAREGRPPAASAAE